MYSWTTVFLYRVWSNTMAIFINKVDHVEGDCTYVDMYCFNIIIGCVLSEFWV
jgi:hypothetical protein